MEKNNAAIIEEIKTTITRLREELTTLENRLSELDFEEPEQDAGVAGTIDGPMAEESLPEEVVVEETAIEESPLDITLDDDISQMEEPQEILEEKPLEAVFEQAAEDAPKVFFESVMPDTLPWKRDVPGSAVQNILSAISLNDRVQFINVLFGGDPLLFQDTVRNFNGFSSLAEAENFIAANFPKWKLDSDVVYRFMMAIRRKLN